MSLANVKESLTVYSFIMISLKNGMRNLHKLYVGVPIAESKVRIGGCSDVPFTLCTFGRPYIIPNREPVGLNVLRHL